MKKRWKLGLAAGIFAVTSVFAGAASAGTVPSSEDVYLIAFQNELPADVESIIQQAGGKVTSAFPELGGVEAVSESPAFLANLKKVETIVSANKELKHKVDNRPKSLAEADIQPVTDIPQPEDISSYWDYQWDIQKVTNSGAAYQLETGGSVNAEGQVVHKAVVGIIDTGIDADHPDLKANIVGGRNFVPAGVDPTETGDPGDIRDRRGHGTHVAGSIAANGKVKGVGPDLGIRSYRIFPAEGEAPTSWIVGALTAAVQDRVDVVNLSISGYSSITGYQIGTDSYKDVADVLLFKRAIRYAVNHNVTVVAAAGNESLDLNNPTKITDYLNAQYGSYGIVFKGASVEVPGQLPGVITVSASNKWSDQSTAFYSNYGTRSIDVAAPGGDFGPGFLQTGNLDDADFHYGTLSTWPTYLGPFLTSNLHGYALQFGTSMAAPKVAGIAGVIKAAHPDYTPAQVSALIKQTAADLGKPGKDPYFGAGEANVYNALTGKK